MDVGAVGVSEDEALGTMITPAFENAGETVFSTMGALIITLRDVG